MAKPESPSEPFKRAVATAVRSLAGEPELEVHFSSEPPSLKGFRMDYVDWGRIDLAAAVDAMSSIADRQRVLRLKTQLHQPDCLISVEDSGAGIDPQNVQRIFDPFCGSGTLLIEAAMSKTRSR